MSGVTRPSYGGFANLHPTNIRADRRVVDVTIAPAFLNDRTAAQVIGTSRESVRQLRLRGVLAFTTEGRSIQIPRESVEQYIETKRAEAQDECLRRARLSGRIDPANAPYMGLIYRTNKKSDRIAANDPAAEAR